MKNVLFIFKKKETDPCLPKCIQMSHSITCSTKIFTLAVAPFLVISVGVFCGFAMVPDMYILMSS